MAGGKGRDRGGGGLGIIAGSIGGENGHDDGWDSEGAFADLSQESGDRSGGYSGGYSGEYSDSGGDSDSRGGREIHEEELTQPKKNQRRRSKDVDTSRSK